MLELGGGASRAVEVDTVLAVPIGNHQLGGNPGVILRGRVRLYLDDERRDSSIHRVCVNMNDVFQFYSELEDLRLRS